MKNISILGSTGSIGTQTLNVVRRHSEDFNVVAILANDNIELLYQQTKEFNPEFVGICNESKMDEAKILFKDTSVKLLFGQEALKICATISSVNLVVAAIVGMAGFLGVYEAIKAKKNIALANKESLVAGGEVIIDLAKQNCVDIYPVDSEHSAVWQCLMGQSKDVNRIILTASGGAFFDYPVEKLNTITPQMACVHPNWSMGKKITVDSSTMMNKALEIIEARWLFNTNKIDYIVHKQSIIHSMVEFIDGAILAQLSNPNMEHAIQLALTYPKRKNTDLEKFKFDKNLTFNEPREDIFIFPKLAKECLKIGGTSGCVFNSVNEASVNLFLNNKISFLDIFKIVDKVLNSTTYAYNVQALEIVETHNYWYNKILCDYKNYI